MTTEKYWKVYNYYLMVYGNEATAHSVAKEELGYEPKNDEHEN